MARVVLNIGSSLTGGLSRIANRNGILIITAYLAIGLLWLATFYSAVAAWIQNTGVSTRGMALPHVDGPFTVMAIGSVLSLLLFQYLTIVALRVFVGGHADSIPSEYYTRNIIGAVINTIVGGIAYSLLVTIGSIFLLIPGIIAYVAFIFMMVYIAVEDENFIAALRDSWQLTRGHWLRLFGLLVVMFVIIGISAGILSAIGTFVFSGAIGRAAGTFVSGIIPLPFSILSLGILAEAFNQLRENHTMTAN